MGEFFTSVIEWFNSLSTTWQLLIEFFVFPFRITSFVVNVLSSLFSYFGNLVANLTALFASLPEELSIISLYLFFGGFVVLLIKWILEAI